MIPAGSSMNLSDLRRLYRLYEYDADVAFPDLSMPCGTLDNYIVTGILTEEEVKSLTEPGRSIHAGTKPAASPAEAAKEGS